MAIAKTLWFFSRAVMSAILVRLTFIAATVTLVLSASAAHACDTCGCCRNGLTSATIMPETLKPTIFSMSRTTTRPAAASFTSGQSAGTPTSFKFAVVGDTQGLVFLEKLTTDMNAHNPALVVYPGDLVDTGSV